MGALGRLVVFLLVLSGSVFIHEYGHYATMRAHGVQVVRLTIGFGPTLWHTTLRDGTEFDIKPILLGGYTEPVAYGPRSLEAVSAAAGVEISLAGMLVNAACGFLLLTLLGLAGAYAPPEGLRRHTARLPRVIGAPAAAAIMSFGYWIAGPPLIAVGYLRNRFGGKPVRFSLTADPPKRGLAKVVFFAAAININLAQFNLLPFRPLDGGAAVSDAIGGAFGRAAADAYDRWSLLAFMALILLSFVSRPRRKT